MVVPITARNAASARADLTKTGGAAFDPQTLTGLRLWFDASDAATITASAGSVSQWNNKKTGATEHLAQATGTSQPTTGTRTVNSKNVLDFDGTADHLLNTAAPTGLNQPNTLWAIARADAFGGVDKHVFDGYSTSRNLFGTTSAGVWAIYAGAALVSGGTRDTNLHLFEVTFNGAASELRIDGTVIATGNPGTTGLNGMYVGSGFGGSETWDGVVAEVIFQNANATSGERTSVRTYSQGKWGTP